MGLVRRARALRRLWHPPATLLGRIRWLFLLFYVFFALTFPPQVLLQSDRPLGLRWLSVALLSALGAWWIRCYRAGRFPAYGLALEALTFVVTGLAAAEPFRALGLLYISVNFRALYGRWHQVLVFTVMAISCFTLDVVVASVTGTADGIGDVVQTLAGVPVLAAITHVAAVAMTRGERATAREHRLAGATLELARGTAEDLPRIVTDTAVALLPDPRGAGARLVAGEALVDAPAGAVLFPLRHHDRCLGHLVVTPGPGGLPEESRDALRSLAAAVAVNLANAELYADLRQRAERDPLTGLANRAVLLSRLDAAVASATEDPGDSTALWLLLLDVDGFKRINDTFGHPAGDRVLVALAHRLTSCVRGDDLVARLGGDEFAIVVHDPSGKPDRGDEVARRIEVALRASVRLCDRDTLVVSASVGVARWRPGVAVDELLRRADEAMYRVKRTRESRHGVSLTG